MINTIQNLYEWSVAQRKNGTNDCLEARISAIEDCLQLLDQHEREVRFKVIGEIDEILDAASHYCDHRTLYEVRDKIKELI
jgi:hypothetical protein